MKSFEVQSLLRETIIKEFELDKINISIQNRAILIRNFFNLLSSESLTKAKELLTDNQKQEFETLIKNQTVQSHSIIFAETINFFKIKNIDYTQIFIEEIIKLKIEFLRNKHTQDSSEGVENFFDKAIDTSQKVVDNKYIVTGTAEDYIEMVQATIEDELSSVEEESKLKERGGAPTPLIAYSSKNEPSHKEIRWLNRKMTILKISRFVINNFLIIVVIEFLFYLISYALLQNDLIDNIPSELDSITPQFIKNVCHYLFN